MPNLFIVATALTVWLSREMIPGSKRFITLAGLFSIISVGLFLAVMGFFEWQQESDVFDHGWQCFRIGVQTTIPASPLCVTVLNRGAVLSFGVVGAGAGLMTGLIGVVTLQIGCTMASAPHIMVGHLTIPLAAAAIGYLMGKTAPLFSGENLMQKLVTSLTLAGAMAFAQTGPEVGATVPDFEAVDQHGKTQTLQSLSGPNGLLLLFHRSADW